MKENGENINKTVSEGLFVINTIRVKRNVKGTQRVRKGKNTTITLKLQDKRYNSNP